MSKVVKFGLLSFACVLVLTTVVLIKQFYVDKHFYKETSEAYAKLYELNSKIDLQSSLPTQQRSGFRNMMESKAVYLTKVRDYTEMKADLSESLKKSGLFLEELISTTSPQSSLNTETELNAEENYEPKVEETFKTQNWVAKIHSKNKSQVQIWLKKNKNDGNIALIVEEITTQGNSTLLRFKSGMIPSMNMPKRVLKIENISLPIYAETFFKLDIFHYQARAKVLAKKFNLLKSKLLAEAPKTLTNIENTDKKKWLWIASIKSKEFIDQAHH